MTTDLARNWWGLAVRGGLAALFGVAAIVWPNITLTVLVGLFGAFIVIDGIFAFVAAVRAGREGARWWTHAFEGVFDVGLGIVVFSVPQLTTLVLMYFVGFWAIFTGIWRLAMALELRREIQGEWLMAATGVISLVFGFGVLAFPGAGALALVTFIGIFALVLGVLSVILAFRLRSWQETMSDEEKMRKAA